jgi:dipeptidyl aminopeptidase/acylaminoacyl peptidase
MKKQLFISFIAVCLFSSAMAQVPKKPIDFTLYDSWKSLSAQKISDDGKWLTWTVNSIAGDGQLHLRVWGEPSDRMILTRANQPDFSPNSDFLIFKIVPAADTIRKAKIKKVKAEKMPKDTLGIYLLSSGQMITYPRVKSFKIAEEKSSWIAFQQEEIAVEAKNDKQDSTQVEKKEVKPKKKPELNGLSLVVVNPITRDSQNFPMVTEYAFSKHGKWLYMVSIKEDSLKTSTVRVFDTGTGLSKDVWSHEGIIKSVVCDEDATQLAFLLTTDTSKVKRYQLHYWSENEKKPKLIVNGHSTGLNAGMSVSEHARLSFSPNGQRLIFGVAKTPVIPSEEKDTLLAEDKVSVDIWHWQEDVLQSVQLKQVDQARKRTYQAVYNIRKEKMVQIADSVFIENYRLAQQGDLDIALGFFDVPYRLNNSVNYKSTKDIYIKDLNTGSDVRVFEKVDFNPQLSPQAKYLYWWEPSDSCWYSYSLKEKESVNLTRDLPVEFVNDIHDTPSDPGSYGLMGWFENDEAIILYDKYDIWKIDPSGSKTPICVTNGYGRSNDVSVRYLSLDPEEKFIDPNKNNLFSVRHLVNKKTGFCRFSMNKPEIKMLRLDDCAYGRPIKSKSADKLVWTRSSVTEYPDIWTSDMNFENAVKTSYANPQQVDYVWANVELVEWNDLNGNLHQGLLYKPENLDPEKKYPMIVYFYERHSDGLHTHYSPRASASTVNPLEYASNGYLVFMPDVHFQIGFPGRSFYNAIMSGIMDLSKRSYIDMKHLGIQGQSWGGYGTAYMITQTGIFAAASPGAPVSNMTSAYGGIRTESGMVRQFQYEKTQSRIGGTLWDKPEYFIENSPLFFADRITTPCLIRHDDADGAVPFSEGVQLFVALRRLQKPAWLINYNDAPHNLSRQSDKKDWSVRMMQFFDHYLKGESAPEWMTKGVNAVDKKKSEIYYWKYTEK